MSNRGVFVMVFVAALAGGMIAIGGYTIVYESPENQPEYNSIQDHQKVALATNYLSSDPNLDTYLVPEGLNFISAAESATSGVVHIRSRYDGATSYNGMWRYRSRPQSSQGSGVIVSDDGYIATNNHVIDGANSIEVTLSDNRRYEAHVIGTDPSTDLALIKIDSKNLTFIPYGDSDNLKIGEWVLAVGNPFNLTSTVTAGIVSAKARNIGIIAQENDLQIESFIQTDAAVNPGNSGGALVDLSGRLVGINTAIATQTGSYSGYSFAVPVTLVKKVMDDLLEFGKVQRALLGIRIQDAALVSRNEAFDVDLVNGVYVASVNRGSAAEDAGIRDGDIIVAIGGKQVNNVQELQELVARNRPGDQIEVTYVRAGIEKTTSAILQKVPNNLFGTERPVEMETEMEMVMEGAVFENLSDKESRDLGISGGVRIKEVNSGVWKEAGIEEGFIITEIDKRPVENTEDIKRILRNKQGDRIIILGLDLEGDRSYYSMRW